MTLTRHLLSFALFAGTSLMLSTGCGGCGGDNNATENNKTTADMGETPDGGGECTPGEAGCTCVAADSSCEGGAMCVDGMCKGVEVTSGLVISGDQARACEILFSESADSKLLGADYADSIEGALRRRSGRVAIAISQKSDAAIESGAVSLMIDGALSGIKIEESRCYDTAGELLGDVTVTLSE